MTANDDENDIEEVEAEIVGEDEPVNDTNEVDE